MYPMVLAVVELSPGFPTYEQQLSSYYPVALSLGWRQSEIEPFLQRRRRGRRHSRHKYFKFNEIYLHKESLATNIEPWSPSV